MINYYSLIFIIISIKLFANNTPYNFNNKLPGWGFAQNYDRDTNFLGWIEKDITGEKRTEFPDCLETAIRNLFNLLLYNSKKNIFDINIIKNINSPYKESFKNFYNIQKPELAGLGTKEIRTEWNKFLADLNSNYHTDNIWIEYGGLNNELNPCFINFINIFRKIFKIKIEDPPHEFNAAKAWLKKSLSMILKIINNNYIYFINLDNIYEDRVRVNNFELSGEIKVLIKDLYQNDLFSFTLKLICTYHGALIDLIYYKNNIGYKIPQEKKFDD